MLDKKRLPRHIAIIMDGNGRWAQQRGLPRISGHKRGIQRVRQIIRAALEIGIRVVTLFAFSTENWKRPRPEVHMLMHAFADFLDKEIVTFQKNNIRFCFLGREEHLSVRLLQKIKKAEMATEKLDALTVVAAFNYGGRTEIVDAAKKFADRFKQGKHTLEQLDEAGFADFLYKPHIPDPDLLIRTSGEQRISNFLLWQLAYTELYFIKKYWPDFGKDELIKAILEYQRRNRRFGAL